MKFGNTDYKFDWKTSIILSVVLTVGLNGCGYVMRGCDAHGSDQKIEQTLDYKVNNSYEKVPELP